MTAKNLSVFLALFLCCGAAASDFKAGFGRRNVTPPIPIWMAGFAARTKPADSIMHDLWTKALALEDSRRGRLVILTIDVVSVPRILTDRVAARLQRKHGLERDRLLINFSHTHSGPSFSWMPNSDRAMIRRIEEYREKVVDAMTDAASDALAGLQTARLSFGQGEVTFSHNRRERVPGGGFRFGVDPTGPVDRTVPVIQIAGVDGRVRGVLFGLSCHTSALTNEFLTISGDYAGVAQLAWEKAHPGAQAMFLQLCGGDQTTHPRSRMELCVKYGNELAAEVDKVRSRKLKPMRAPLRVATLGVELPFADYSLEKFDREAADPDTRLKQHGERMLKMYQSGQAPTHRLLYGMQAVRFGDNVTLLAMNGEVVVEYALRAKREFGADDLIVAGYSNEIHCYIPSLRILKEGGYEGRDAILSGSLPGVLGEQVEETIFSGIRELMQKLGRAPAR